MRSLFVIFLVVVGFLAACSGSRKKVESGKTNFVLESASNFIQKEQYDLKSVKLGETTFHLFGRKKNGLGLLSLEQSLQKAWPHFQKHFKNKPTDVTVIDFDAPIGGGPLAPFTIGIFYSEAILNEHQNVILESTGWSANDSTSEYIRDKYSSFSDPKQAYVDDIMVHEFGHLFFGWGFTRVDETDPNSWWFSFGMGLLYDRLAWNELYKIPSPLFTSIQATWSEKFSKRANIDQRLVNPETSADKKNGLQRLQTYGHGKAYAFLKELRNRIGVEMFDQAMNTFVFEKQGQVAAYEHFIQKLPSQVHDRVKSVEKDFSIR